MPPELTVVGSANLDLVARVERLPRPGETLTGATFSRHPGGKGANQAVAAARLGAQARFVGCVGADTFAEDALADLRAAGVALAVDESADEHTGVAMILVDASGDNTIAVAPGANRRVRPPELSSDEKVLCQLEIPVETSLACARRAAFFCLNAAPAVGVPPELVELSDLVVANRYEFEELPVTPKLTALTLGEEGAVLLERGREVVRARPPRIDAVDGTAAGDAFVACLVVARLEGRTWEDGLVRACAAGALAASRAGAQPSLPTAAELEQVLAA